MAQMILRKNGLRILRSDAGREGVTGLKKTCNLAESFGLRCEIHTMSMTALQVALSASNCHYFEDTLQDVLDDKKEGLRERADGHPYKIDKEGFVHGPAEPGLGLGFDWTPFKRTKIETLR
jgi:L-alanine-DL-glutamate epimerase-like enolase superfamily enzyme